MSREQSTPSPPTRLPEITPQPAQSKPEARRSGCYYGVVGALGCLLLLLTPIVIAVLLGITTFGSVFDSIWSIFRPSPPVATVFSTDTIVQGIQPMGELVSISAQLAKADITIGIQQGVLNACGYGASHVAQATIQAGVDLTGVTSSNIVYDPTADTYLLTLPAPRLTNCRIDDIRQYDTTTTTCSVDWDEARRLAEYIALQEFRDDAIEGGILSRAEREVRIVLGNFVQILTGSRVEIGFSAPATAPLMDASCQPQPPAGWVQDANTGAWVKQ
jgi:hypothetical protein